MALRTQTREKFRNQRAGISLCRAEMGVREGHLAMDAGGTVQSLRGLWHVWELAREAWAGQVGMGVEVPGNLKPTVRGWSRGLG